MKTTKQLIGMMIIGLLITSCESSKNSDAVLAEQTEKSMQQANQQIGMPGIVNFQERKLAKMIFELRDQENLICFAYLMNVMTGEIGQYLGKCIGFGLPYSVQFTNPEKCDWHSHGGSHSLPQADPNGLFMPSGLSATWLMLLDESGQPHPVYIEPQIIVSPFKLK